MYGRKTLPTTSPVAGAAMAALVMITGCTKAVVVETTFPEPVIESLDIDVAVYYTDALKTYDYEEDLPNDIDWEITLGEANIMMFDRAFEALFDDVVVVNQPGGSGAPFDGVDIVIEPKVEAFEFSLPRQSRSDQYAVWIRYNLALSEADGTHITNWLVSAYGQADSRLLRGGTAMEAAVVRAMRDAIANIVIGFEQDAKIRAALWPEETPTETAPEEELAAEPASPDEVAPDAEPDTEAPPEDAAAPDQADQEAQS